MSDTTDDIRMVASTPNTPWILARDTLIDESDGWQGVVEYRHPAGLRVVAKCCRDERTVIGSLREPETDERVAW